MMLTDKNRTNLTMHGVFLDKGKFILPVLIVLSIFFILPLIRLIGASLFSPAFTLDNYFRVFGSSVYLNVIWITLELSIIVTTLCLLLGYPFAFFLFKSKVRIKKVLFVLIVLPLWVNPLSYIQGWRILLQREGIINHLMLNMKIINEPLQLLYNMFGVVVAMVYFLLPFMVLSIYASINELDWNLVKAARNLGASPMQSFQRIIFPLTFSGIGAGCFLVFILAIGYFVTPTLLGGRSELVISRVIDEQINRLFNWGFGSALTVLLFFVIIMLFLFLRFLPGRAMIQESLKKFYVQ